mmetsp:Transcript_27009/g.30898  ORF Transcript_27009/g.30898 Transcript_27009/m.30898 type:complete len:971 (+) Transcript_27009:383-3295(+)
MRMGQSVDKGKKPHQKNPVLKPSNENKGNEKNVGRQISCNLIDAVFMETLTLIANKQSEIYAEVLLEHEDLMSSDQSIQEQKHNFDSYLFASKETREDFLTLLNDTSRHFTTVGKKVPQWKVHANAAKFERNLNEKYGRFRPFITKYPEIEITLRNIQRKYSRGECSPFRQGPAPIDKKASIILLVIMHRNGVRFEAIMLTALFLLVGMQPWALVLLITLGHLTFERRKKKKISGWLGDKVKPVKSYYAEATTEKREESKASKQKHKVLFRPVGVPILPTDFKTAEETEDKYETIIVGSGADTLYTAALLARSGRSVLVLSEDEDASGCRRIQYNESKDLEKYANVPFDIHSNNVAHTSVQQQILSPALCTETDAQGGIRFAQIGTEADGFTSDILSIPGMGVDSYKDSLPFLIRAGGISTIPQDAATFLGDGWPNEDNSESNGNSASSGYLTVCAGVNTTAKEFYVGKLLPKKISEMKKGTSYQEASSRWASCFLDKFLPYNPHVRSLMAGIGMRGENLPPSKTSMAAHVTNISACLSPEGFSYPVGGPRALCHALTTVIEQNGGKVVTGVRLKEFLFHEVDESKTENSNEVGTETTNPNNPRCFGVKLEDGRIISVGMHEESCVVSMLGFLKTFVFHMPLDIRAKYSLPSGFPLLSERRPLLKLLIGLRGNHNELNLTGADWYRLPNASLALDEKNPVTGEIIPGFIGSDEVSENGDVDDEGTTDEATTTEVDGIDNSTNKSREKRARNPTSRRKSRRFEFMPGSSWMKVSFPSAKDPSWTERHNGISTCVVTIEAGSDFVRSFETSPNIFSQIKTSSSEINRLMEKVTKELLCIFPQLEGKIECCEMVGPIRGGLSNNPQKFAAKGIRPKTAYPGLFVGGSDLTVGDAFSPSIVGGWLAANAVLGYSFFDYLFLEKNITNDLARFLPASSSGEEDIAVPFQAEFPKCMKSIDNPTNKNDAAESSKEK